MQAYEIDEEQEWSSTEEEIIEEFKAFAKRANENDHDFYKRVKQDRAFEAGEQWGQADKTNRGQNRAEMTINLCGVFIASVINPFNAKPFKFKAVPRYVEDVDEQQQAAQFGVIAQPVSYNEEICKLNEHLTNIQNDFCTNESNTQGLHDAVGTGIGFTYATIEDIEGEKKIKYLHIEDQTMVVVDPEAKGVALQEADRIAVVDTMLLSTAREKYGDDIIAGENSGEAKLTNFGSSWEIPKDHVAVITYYRKDGHNVEYFRLCGDHIVDYGVFEGLEYLPIFAFTGDRVWIDKKRTFSGIIRKVKNQQKIINYAQSQLIERLAKSPKGFFVGYTEMFQNHEDSVQNAEYGTSTIVETNLFAPNGKTQLPLPQFVQPHVITEDIFSIVNQSINQMSVATGISPNGIVEQNLTDQKTATEVLLRTKSSQSNVSNYISHAKETIRVAGNVIAHLCVMLYGLNLPKGSYDIVVEEGCVSLTKMEEDREKLLALAQIVPESFKPLISQRIVKTLDIEGGEELSAQLYNMLPAELRGGLPSMQEFQAQNLKMQELQQALAEAQQQNKDLNDQLTQAQLRTKTDLIMEDKKFQHQVQMELIKNSEQEKVDAQHILIDAAREAKAEENDLKKAAMEQQTRVNEKAIEAIAGLSNKEQQPPSQM